MIGRPETCLLCLSAIGILMALGGCEPEAPPPKAHERAKHPPFVLFEFEQPLDVQTLDPRNVTLRTAPSKAGTALRVHSGHKIAWPGFTLKPPAEKWDLSSYEELALDVKNVGANDVTVCCRVDNPGGDGSRNCITGSIKLTPGQADTLSIRLDRKPPESCRIEFFGMRGTPLGMSTKRILDPGNVIQLIVFVPRPTADHAFEIDNIRATGHYDAPPELALGKDAFFPMIDQFGQYMHRDWPGKIHSADAFAKRKAKEPEDLHKHPGPADRNRYGGWTAGPTLKAKGHFYPAKHDGNWWLVDPKGRLFWSHGIDCVGFHNATTPITDRKHWFKDLPKKGSPLARFCGRGSWAPHGYYTGKRYETYNFTGANLFTKYGESWERDAREITHRRLRSWGMNTIANWSNAEIYLQRKTPYVVSIHFGGKIIEGSKGYWGKFRDVFDPSFRKALRDRMAKEKRTSAGDAWCIGYFVDNELGWGSETSLAEGVLASPPSQPAKKVFVDDLKKKHETIDKLNRAWGTTHPSWDALLQCTEPPDAEKAKDDLCAFYTKIAETYFRECRDAVKAVAPENLYLGCRFAWVNDRAARAAAKYCDVISYNRYRPGVEDLRPPEGIDRPVIIGEFHFGALDRGMFHTGLQPTDSQAARAAAYKSYVAGALRNSFIVGTHWFQYGDQATTGRGDGENYQIGFLDVCDTPYPETIAACREVGYRLYAERAKAKSKP